LATRGRKPKTFPQQEIDQLIYRFIQQEKASGWIKYTEVYSYAKKLYENGEIPYHLSEDFWRRKNKQGKESVDRINKAYEASLVSKKTSKSDLYINTEECVNKFFTGKPSDKKRLIDALRLNEKKAKDYSELLIKNDALTDTIKSLVAEKKELEEKISQFQMVLFSWFNASIKSDVPLINLMTTGKTRHPIVDFFFDTAFATPQEGFEKFEEYRKKIKENNKEVVQQNNNVTPFRDGIEAIRQKHKKQ
jgi:hypothetical protein